MVVYLNIGLPEKCTMTIKVKYLEEGQGIEFILSGVVHGSDIIEIHKEIHSPKVVAKLKFKIIDKSNVTENYVSVEEVKAISELDTNINDINGNIITAFISPNDLVRSLGDLWKEYIKDSSDSIRTFETREEANKWLATKLDKA